MTFIETLIVLCIMSFLGLAVFTALSGGIKIWNRALEFNYGQDTAIFFDKFSSDVRRSVPFSMIYFEGEYDKLSFPVSKDGILEVIGYKFDSSNRCVIREEKDFMAYFLKKDGAKRALLKDVYNFKMEYLYNPDDKTNPVPKPFIKDGFIPQFIKIELTLGKNYTKRTKMIRIFEVPIGRNISLN